MNAQEEQQLVHAYLQHLDYQRMPIPTSREEMRRSLEEHKRRVDSDPYFEAWEELTDLCCKDPSSAMSVVLELVSRCQWDDLSTLGAGPIEDLAHRHAATLADEIEHLIRTNDRFLEAYRFVNMGGVPLVVQRRLNDVLVERGVPRESICEFPESYDFDDDV